MNPRVTVIIPCFNDGELAEEAVASIREAEPVEVIVIDDGSDEQSSLEALARLAALPHTKVARQANAGLSAARMTGLRLCNTPYLFTLDSDDHLTAGALADLADALDASPEAQFAFGDYESFGDHCGRWKAPVFSAWMAMHANWWGPAALFRVEALRRIGGWSLEGGYEDWDLWLAFAGQEATGVRVPRVVWRRRLHGARMQGACRTDHMARYRVLRSRHRPLFARRAKIARAERVPRLRRVIYPLVLGGRPLMPIWLESRLLPLWWRVGAWRSRRREGG